ncbi:TraR/DksA family transcriptional regulator [Candidatus Binatus sp.]|uniref:TraR/DksA family transcriptional regulator n=1 Tax=Candidatus Binatus sp. TaxID=2811406 RepID=UPI003CC64B3C
MFKRQARINHKSFGMESLGLESSGRTHARSQSRAEALRATLADLRNQEIQRRKSLMRSELAQERSSPGDASDAARVQESMELNMSLIELSERRLGAIWAAFDRLETGHYGLCEECAGEIAFERLRAVPTALYCVDCQAQYEAGGRARRAG